MCTCLKSCTEIYGKKVGSWVPEFHSPEAISNLRFGNYFKIKIEITLLI